ncbi:unnamed protein product [Blepharisma stoltei]|uniref:Uncharacterized protein n=1 Tax=Blepharisma stoltei TaxID=1481888 RepID=A0AAU9IKH4_9CILI|nr:unnamed protein product [Blepharisma stoltei]
MVTNYLSNILSSIKSKAKTQESVQGSLSSSALKIISHIKQASIPFSKSPDDLQTVINNLLSKINSSNVDENVRQAKLKEIKKQKELLEAKLSSIEESISTLDNIGSIQNENKLNKPNLQNARTRQEYLENERKKAEEAAQKIKAYYKEQKERAKKKQQEQSKLMMILEEESEAKKQEMEELKAKKEQEYYEKLEKMKELKAKRQQEIDEIRRRNNDYESIKGVKPLYVKLEEKFKCEYELPELEKRKSELAKRKLVNRSINQEKIIEHMKWYDVLRDEHTKRNEEALNSRKIENKVRSSSCTWNAKILEQEKQLKEAQNAANIERLQKIEKRLRYAELIKEMFMPTVDKTKQLELQERLEKMKNPARHHRILSEINQRSESFVELEKKKIKPRKIQSQSKTVETPKVAKKINYLEEKRKLREENEKNMPVEEIKANWDDVLSMSVSDTEKVKIISEKVSKLEKQAILKEHLVSSTNPMNIKALAQQENIDNLLVGSIKAKLAVFSHAVNKSVTSD